MAGKAHSKFLEHLPYCIFTGTIFLTNTLPSGERLYSLRIDAVDGGGRHSGEPAEVYLSVKGPNYNPPQFERDMYRYSISEKVDPDAYVGSVRATYAGSSSSK